MTMERQGESTSATAAAPDGRGREPAAALLVGLSAVAYLVLGAAGIAMAPGPGLASPVFPAAGLALALALRFGWRAVAGILAGALALNLGLAGWRGGITPVGLAVAAVVSLGSAAQAAAGRWLVIRGQGQAWRTLETEKEALRFLLLGGPLPGLIAPTVAVAALAAAGHVGRAGALHTWLTWYAGDLTGVLVLAPLALCFLEGIRSPWRERRRRIVGPLVATLILVTLAYHGAARWEAQERAERLRSDAGQVAGLVEHRLIAHREVLSALRNFLGASPRVGFGEFDRYARAVLAENRDLFALSLNARVTETERPGFEEAMSRQSPLGNYRITERDAQGRLVPAGRRSEHVAVQFIAPLAENGPALGYDVASDPLRRLAVERAGATGAFHVTPPIQLVQERQPRVGALEILPVPPAAGWDPTGDGRPRSFVVAVVKLDEMIGMATEGRVPAGLAFQVTDPRAPAGRQLLHASTPAAGSGERTGSDAATWTASIEVAGAQWSLAVRASDAYLQGQRNSLAWAVGAAGLLFAALLQVLLLGMTGRAAAVQAAHDALRVSEEQYRGLLDNLHAGVVVFAPDGRVVLGNAKASSLLGVLPDRLERMSAADTGWRLVRGDGAAVPPGELPASRVLATGTPVDGQVMGVDRPATRERTWVLASAYPVTRGGGELVHVVATFVDITDRRRSEEALENERSGLQLALEAARAGAWELDQATQETRFSAGFSRLHGVENSAAMATRDAWMAAIHAEDRERVARTLEVAARAGVEFDVSYRVSEPRGREVRWMLARGRPVHGAGAKVDRYVGVAMDVTEARRAEEASRASDEKNRFLAVMSHEIRTPLNGILGFSSLLEERLADAADKDSARRIREAAETLTRIVNDVLDASSIAAGRLHLEIKPFPVASLVESAASLYRRAAHAKGLLFTVRTEEPGGLHLWGDAVRIRQVIQNLLANAVKFTSGGSVAIRVAATPEGLRRWKLDVEVRDTGIGMDAGQVERVFIPFSQADSSIHRRFGGTGLGLSISRGIVEAMGGTIGVTSAPGKGSCFRFQVVFHEAEVAMAADAEVSEAPARRRVLVVDDSPVNRLLGKRLLERDGHVVGEAEDGEQAVAMATTTPYDLILMDVDMPGMSGLEATRAIRAAAGPSQHTAIFALTGMAFESDVAAARAAGMDGHIAKPVSPDRLRKVLAEVSPRGAA